jgi:tripartite-type tricarboxylate transporter receptor subunit TctC
MNALARAAIAAALLLVPAFASAQAWPERTVKLVVPFGPGGANDLIGRAAAEALAKRLGQPVIIENKPGAGAVIGTEYVAKSKPDGYTFLVGAAGVVTNTFLHEKLSYQDSDLVPVGMIAVAPSVIVVHPSVPASNMKELVAYAKSLGASGLNWSTAGGGSTPHFVAEMLKNSTGATVTIVPYKSGSEGVTAVISNNVHATSEASIVVLPQVKAGKLKAIATTYERRISAYDQLPTTAEQGFPDVRIGHWAGLFAPRGTPQAIVDRLAKELQAAVQSPEFRDKLQPSGIEPAPGTTADFAAFVKAERERLGAIARKAGMKSDH